jgi:hypothetical protein
MIGGPFPIRGMSDTSRNLTTLLVVSEHTVDVAGTVAAVRAALNTASEAIAKRDAGKHIEALLSLPKDLRIAGTSAGLALL